MNTQSAQSPDILENLAFILPRFCPLATRRVPWRTPARGGHVGTGRAGVRHGVRSEITASRWMAESA